MQVLIVSWEFPPLVVGGLGRHVGRLATELARAGHDVRVLTRGTGPEAVIECVDGVRVHRAAADALDIGLTGESVLAWAQAFEHSLVRAGLALLRDWQPDVIHAHDWLVAQTTHTLAAESGAPVVVTLHATEHGRQQQWLGEAVPRSIHSVERWLARDANRVLVCSRFMAAEVRALFGVETVTVIGNGSDPVTASGSEFRRTDGPHLAFAGRLVHEKGLQELIKALPLLRADYPGLHLSVAGTGSLLADQQDRAARYGVADMISWLGFVDSGTLFAAADIVVVPSLYEPYGLVAIEAQQAGTPVAVSDTGGLAEIVEDGVTGVRFAPESPAAIATAVRRLLKNPLQTRAIVAAAGRQAAEFSWAAVAERTAQAYRQVLR